MKSLRLVQAEGRAHQLHLEWQGNREALERSRQTRDAEWAQQVERKRLDVEERYGHVLEQARQRYQESREALENLIREKDIEHRRRLDEVHLKRRASFLNRRALEEARRMAVEEAVERLLARDSQYREELRSHSEARHSEARRRRDLFRNLQQKVRLLDILDILTSV